MSFYGVYVPLKFETAANGEPTDNNKRPQLVFSNRDEAFKVLKTHTDARLKVFDCREDAQYFAQYGSDVTTADQSVGSRLKSPSTAINPEVAAFRGPKIQELVEFRKAIESGKLTVVHAKIMENPRYLVGSGDTPTILKESVRYNAIHVAALAKNAKMCELILSTISKPSYIQLFHGRMNKRIGEEVATILLDLYLNMPEKGRNETPLHLAAKYGAADVVEVLTSYPQCKMLPNNEDKLPKELIGFRAPSCSDEVRDRIRNLLEERFYVPVIRSVDNTMPPIIGEPFSVKRMPALNGSGPQLTPELQIKAYAGPMDQEQADSFRRRWKTPPPISFNRSLNNSSLSFNSSPNSNAGSELLLLRSPIRSKATVATVKESSFVSTPNKMHRMATIGEFIQREEKKTDQDESHSSSRTPVNTLQVPGLLSAKKSLFSSFRQRLNSPLNGSSAKEADDFDEALDDDMNSSYRERHLKCTDSEKGLEVVGRMLAKEQNVGWKEYWPFLDSFVNLATADGLQQLEVHLKGRAEKGDSTRDQVDSEKGVAMVKGRLNLSDICERLNEFHLKVTPSKEKQSPIENCFRNGMAGGSANGVSDSTAVDQNIISPAPLTAYLCVEKSCQVYAKRVIKVIVNNFDNTVTLNAALNAELVRLESLVCSYKDDVRFKRINFQCVHSRFAHLILTYLLDDDATYRNLVPRLEHSFQAILSARTRLATDEESQQLGASTIMMEGRRVGPAEAGPATINGVDAAVCDTIKTTSHSKCLSSYLIRFAKPEADGTLRKAVGPENLKTEKDCEVVWSNEARCECEWNSRNAGQGGNSNHLKYPHLMRMRDKAKKKRINTMIKKKKINLAQAPQFGMWDHRKISTSTDSDEDVFWSDAYESDQSVESTDSDDCLFYTPVESPSEFLTASENSDGDEDDRLDSKKHKRQSKTKTQHRKFVDLRTYRNYMLGDEPTKTDIDVYNAICDTELDEAQYSNVVKWQNAIRMHPPEDIQSFPSLSFVVRRSIPIGKAPLVAAVANNTTPTVASRRLFGSASPMK